METIDQKANRTILKWMEENEGRWDEHDSSTVDNLLNYLKKNGLQFIAHQSEQQGESQLKPQEEEEKINWNEFKKCFYDYYSLGNKTREELYEWIKTFFG